MLTEHDEMVIQALARKYGARRVLLFGSMAREDGVGRDIDLAVSGIAAADFFSFYGELMYAIAIPVDLVDLDKDSQFTRLIQKEGIPVYEQAA